MTLIYGVVLGLVVIPFAGPLLGVFLRNPATAALAYLPLVLWALLIGVDAAGLVLMNSLIGAGDTRRSMWISVLWQWAFFLPLAFVVGPVLGYGLLGVWILNGVYRIGQSLVCAQQWAGRKWAHIEI
jgi:MATE family multidrug resistance protein